MAGRTWVFGQRLKEAVRSELPLHLVLDAGRMAEHSDLGLTAVATVMRKLGQLQESQQLRFVTLGELARQNLSRRASQPSRSILAA